MVYAADLGSVASGVEVRVLSKALKIPQVVARALSARAIVNSVGT